MRARLWLGDCFVRLAALPDASVGMTICDPPYGLEFMGKEWDRLDGVGTGGATFTEDGIGKGFKALPSYSGSPNPLCLNCGGSKRGRDRKGFHVCRCASPEFPNIGREQGRGMQEWHTRWLTEVYRVLVPGGRVKVFGGTRVYHRLAVAMEQAGFMDVCFDGWTYGSGFPKSLAVGKAIDKAAGAQRDVVGFDPTATARQNKQRKGIAWTGLPDGGFSHPEQVGQITRPASAAAARWEGWGTAMKPGWEPILVGRKP